MLRLATRGRILESVAPRAVLVVKAIRSMSEPGWQKKLSTKDSRSREQRETERKARQLEKLPKPEALHDFEYPHDKTLLCDQWLQPPVFADELDSPSLYQLHPPDDFFVFWNATDFDRSAYPPLPASDYRRLAPDSASFRAHSSRGDDYLRKHGIVPNFFPRVDRVANVSFCFGGSNAGQVESFWTTAHYGNFIELKDVQKLPTIYCSGVSSTDTEGYYCFVMASPDYPHRSTAQSGFFLHAVVANIQFNSGAGEVALDSCKTVVPFVPPLPTEDAGSSRHLCMLFKQKQRVSSERDGDALSFGERSNYRMHVADGAAGAHSCSQLRAVEAVLEGVPSALQFFTTTWDIQVQEFYEKHGLPEPVYWPSDVEDVLRFNALPTSFHRPSSRMLPDGSINDGETKHQHARLNLWMSTAHHHLSAKSLNDAVGRPLPRPKI